MLTTTHTLIHTQLQSQMESRVGCSLRGFEQAVVWDRLNIELELYVSIYISGTGSAPGAAKQSLNQIQFTRRISWIVFPSPHVSLGSPSKSHFLPLGAQLGHRGPSVPFLGNLMCCQTKESWHLYSHIHTFVCVNADCGILVKRAIILICARLGGGRRGGGFVSGGK